MDSVGHEAVEDHHVAAKVDKTVVRECVQDERKTPGLGSWITHEPPHHGGLEARYFPGQEHKNV